MKKGANVNIQHANTTAIYHLAMRKYVQADSVQYWLLIKGKSVEDGEEVPLTVQDSKRSFLELYISLVQSNYWKSFLIVTVLLNVTLFMSYFWWIGDSAYQTILILMILTCLFYWIDFIGAILEARRNKRTAPNEETRKVIFLVLDAISLLPASILSLILDSTNYEKAWQLRSFTLLRFYRIPHFFSQIATAEKTHWKILVTTYGCYMLIFAVGFANLFLWGIEGYSPVTIQNWNMTTPNRIIFSGYYVIQIMLNVAYGDIRPETYLHMLINSAGMVFGTAMTTGVLTGIMATSFVNRWKRREQCRFEYDVTITTLKERKIDKKIFDKVLENMMILWKYRQGYLSSPSLAILPLSLQKEIHFDINFGLLHRSLVFSSQPRAFLRSVTIFMKNVSYLPGDIIVEPYEMSDAMICVASGVIEVLSEENDETVLFSLTTGTIVGEASLFLSITTKCIVRAATYVEIQVLMKDDFSRLALTYPDIFRSMRMEILSRLSLISNQSIFSKNFDSDVKEISRRKETKKFLKKLRGLSENPSEKQYNAYRKGFLNLYVLSENIPKVKTLPVNLIKGKPWILRPETPMKKFWDVFIVVIAFIYSIAVPSWAAFYREIAPYMRIFTVMAEIIFILDVYVEMTTAIERKDHFTFIATVKEILAQKLKKFGFYLDVLATYYLGVYAPLVMPENVDYATLLLAMNGVLKVWCLFDFITRAEDQMKNNLLFVLTTKFCIYFCIIIIWSGVALYLEACPGEACLPDRWLGALEMEEVEAKHPTPLSEIPMTTSLYFGTVSLFTLGYGDIIVHCVLDCLIVIILMILGDLAINLCMAQMSSVFKHLERVKTDYQEEIFAVDDLMKEHEIPEEYKLRVRNYLRLQWEYDKGYSLKRTAVTDVLPILQKRVILIGLMKAFSTVSLFRNANPDFLKLLAKISRVRVLPPYEDITEGGSLVREMYILENGFCETWSENDVKNKKIIGPMNVYGCYEMITGKPQPLTVRTVTHARVISLGYSGYLMAVTKYPSVKVQIDEILKSDANSATIHSIKPIVTPQNYKATVEKQKQILSKAFINVYKYYNTISISYWEPFSAWGKFRFCQFFFLPFVISPNSLFIKIWMTVRLLNVMVIGILAPIRFSIMEVQTSSMSYIILLQVCFAIDMYLMFHVAYYNTEGLLIFHPAKTVTWYLKGNFFIDLIALCPFNWLFTALLDSSEPLIFNDAIGFLMVLQFYKFFQACSYLENDILMKTDQIKMLKYVPFVIIVINFIAGALLLVQCTDTDSFMGENIMYKTHLDNELRDSLRSFCLQGRNNNTMDVYESFTLYLLTLYWVCETLLGCGYGDIVSYNKITMIAIILIIIAGVFFFTFLFASITGSMVNTNVLIVQYRRRMLRMIKFMKAKNVSQDLQKRLIKHYEYSWHRTEGATPQEIFTFVHLALREKIFASMYGQTVGRNPAFKGMEKQVISVIGKNLTALFYLKGESIVKYQDVLEHIYFIYRGEVNLLTQDGAFKASMGNGGVFGNISNKPFCLSKEEVVATNNVDLLQMDTKTFFNTLKVFPNTVKLTDYLMRRRDNYILPVRDELTDRSQSIYKLNLYHMDWPSSNMRKSESYLKGNFYLKKTLYKSEGRFCSSFVILPDSHLSIIIEMFSLVLSVMNPSVSIYVFCFQDFNIGWLVLGYLLDVGCYFELFLNFHTAFFDKSGYCVVDLKVIKNRYLNSKKIVYDVVACVPWDLFGFIAHAGWKLKCMSLLRLNRVIKVYNVLKFFELKQRKLMVNKIYLQAGWILVAISIIIHFLACIWFLGACPLGNCLEPNWISHSNLEGKEKWEYYFYSAFYVLIIVTTTGYQAVEICRASELILSMIFMITCRFVVVLLSAVLVTAINAQSLNLFLFQERIAELVMAFTRQNLSSYQMSKLWNYLAMLWLGEAGKQMPKFITQAPYTLKCEVMNEMFGSHLSQSYTFSNLNPAFIRQLSCCLKRFMYFTGNYIVYQGDIDATMYFIHKGEVSVLTIHPDLLDTVHFRLTDNDHFGLKQGLLPGYAHNFTYRAETTVDIITLTLKDWQHLLKYFPEDASIIAERVESLPPEVQNTTQ